MGGLCSRDMGAIPRI